MAKININTANGRKRNKHYIPTVTLTTEDSGTLQPTNIIICQAGDHIDTTFNRVSQSQPTAVRTFGSFDLKSFAFFVPFKTVWRHYEDWAVSSVDATINVDHSPTVNLMTILNVLCGLSYNEFQGGYIWSVTDTDYFNAESNIIANYSKTYLEIDALSTKYDFICRDRQGYTGGHLTAKGRMLLKVLQGLGYELPKRFDLSGIPDDSSNPLYSMVYNAVPILSFARIFYDYIFPSAYVQQQGFGGFFEQDDWDFGSSEAGAFTFDGLCQMLFTPYSQDFFNALWLKPNSKSAGTGSSFFPSTPVLHPGTESGYDSLKIQSGENVSQVIQNSSSNVNTLSANALRWLEDVSDYVIRNNIGGTRFHEWMKAHFGWVSDDQDSNRSVFLKSFSSKLSFSPVTASTGSDSQLLGQMAANGLSNSSGRLKFEAKEDGFIIFLSMVVPSTAYYQGVKPWCNALNSRFDLYVPELDSVGMQPVPRSEVFFSYERMHDVAIAPIAQHNNAFGFAPRYADLYKRGNSFLNGDFRLPTRNTDLDAYHTFRDVLYNRNNLALDAQFLEADNQYNRIFAVPLTDGEEVKREHIESLFLFDTNRYSTASSIGDSMPIFNRSGQSVNLDNGGTQLN